MPGSRIDEGTKKGDKSMFQLLLKKLPEVYQMMEFYLLLMEAG